MTKERPILFSGAMVRAIPDGRKMQTRRVVTGSGLGMLNDGFTPDYVVLRENGYCRYAYTGDRLWARETWAQPAALDPGPTVYRADYPTWVPLGNPNIPPVEAIRWKPSIYIPRAACRLVLGGPTSVWGG
ncbi:conserved hypothetical protein [Cupriavidus necator]|uniref:Uncharacterized protein n=1 Tax=Cupriavidus necator TaxID=106590 RepID=A0A1K0JH80_CUPNE|nr:conserved hypothetical protein [Cupriavidus necator]